MCIRDSKSAWLDDASRCIQDAAERSRWDVVFGSLRSIAKPSPSPPVLLTGDGSAASPSSRDAL
eukprot:177085-Prorocentrum_lima.AAC.1